MKICIDDRFVKISYFLVTLHKCILGFIETVANKESRFIINSSVSESHTRYVKYM